MKELTQAIVDLREDDALALVDRQLADGADPVVILADCKAAMDVIGERFANGEAFIPELIMAGEIMTGISGKLKPHLTAATPEEKLGVIVIGTVQGDIHDIGKDIVVTMLDIAGFDVVDLGVDVKIEKFISTAQEKGAQIIAMSCLLTSAIDSMKKVVAAAREAGLDGTKLMIGGAPVTEQVVAYTGADGYGKDAVEAVELAKQWIGGK
ncbi:MAG TPA: cobalamin-dependent protein [Thermoleophilia bacterium]|nr:cobalamin-dependent protein [Thermoleophilia bacterium]